MILGTGVNVAQKALALRACLISGFSSTQLESSLLRADTPAGPWPCLLGTFLMTDTENHPAVGRLAASRSLTVPALSSSSSFGLAHQTGTEASNALSRGPQHLLTVTSWWAPSLNPHVLWSLCPRTQAAMGNPSSRCLWDGNVGFPHPHSIPLSVQWSAPHVPASPPVFAPPPPRS